MIHITKLVKKGDSLFASPTSNRVVGRIMPQDTVVALTGELRIMPELIKVTTDHTLVAWDHMGNRHRLQLRAGDRLYLLGSSEDQLGLWKILAKTNRYEADLDPEALRRCAHPSDICWASLNRSSENQMWWVQLKTTDGIIGWVKVKSGEFVLPDSCGGTKFSAELSTR